jgi:hypothetical protein
MQRGFSRTMFIHLEYAICLSKPTTTTTTTTTTTIIKCKCLLQYVEILQHPSFKTLDEPPNPKP